MTDMAWLAVAVIIVLGAAGGAILEYRRTPRAFALACGFAGLLIGAVAPVLIVFFGHRPRIIFMEPGLLLYLIGLGWLAWKVMERLAQAASRGLLGFAAPALFGAWLLYVWEIVVVGFGIPQILLPAPHQILAQLIGHADVLWGDFRQTFLKAVVSGWAAGCGLGFVVAV